MSTFGNYVTNTAFSLSLSKPMIDALCRAHKYGDTFVMGMTCNSLINRGLAETYDKYPHLRECGLQSVIRLTHAGKLLIPLIKEAGLYVQYPDLPEEVEIPKATIGIKQPLTD